jgi:hypothetical protein
MSETVTKYIGAWTVWFMADNNHPYPVNELHNLSTTEYFQAISITDQLKPILVKALMGGFNHDITELVLEKNTTTVEYSEESI